MTAFQTLRLGLTIATVTAVLDQALKWWIVEHVMQPPRVIPITPFFNLVMGWNRGVSFGLFNSDSPWSQWLLSALAGVIVVALVIWLRQVSRRRLAAAIGLVIGGAIGNVIDRLRYGAVADFLDLHVAGEHWPAFNLADSAITVGAVVLVLDALFGPTEQHKKGTSDRAKDQP